MSAYQIELPGTGEDVATDLISAKHYQLVKLSIGAIGVNDGPVSAANPLPVEGTVTIDTTGLATDALQTSGNAILTTINASADAIEASVAAIDTSANAIEASTASLASVVKAEDSASADGDPGLLVLGQRKDDDSTAVSADGDYSTLKLDEQGRLKVSSKPASYPDITGDITAVQATIGVPVAGGTMEGDVSRASNVMAFCNGTFSAVNCTFEGSLESSGDANWFGIQAVRSNANTIETTTGSLSAQPAYAWEMSVNALKRLRVRCTARTSGTQSWRFVQGTYATEPIPAAQVSGTQPVSGTVTANIGTGSLAAGTNLYGDVGLQARANATGAASGVHIVSAATTNATNAKASAGRVLGWSLANTNAAWRYVKLHNTAGTPTAGASVARTIAIPPNGKSDFSLPVGIAFATGIGYTIVTGSADADATAVAVGDVVGDLFFA